MANSAILLDVPAESIHTIGLGSIWIRPRLTAQAIGASAVIGRKPATTPIPIANPEACSVFIFATCSLAHYLRQFNAEKSDDRSDCDAVARLELLPLRY